MHNSPSKVASVLEWEFGIDGGIRYAKHIENSRGPLSDEYRQAREILEARKRASMCEDCGVYPADHPAKVCCGCEAYREHTAV